MTLLTNKGNQLDSSTKAPLGVNRYAPELPVGTPVTFDGDLINPMEGSIESIANDSIIVDAIKWNYEECERAKEPFVRKMDRVQKRYNNEYDHEGKEDWQSKKNYPKVLMTVERLTAVISRILTLARDDWFNLYSYNTGLKPYFSLFRDMLQDAMNNDRVKFFNIFQDAVKSGLKSLMMAVVVSWVVDEVESYDQPPAPESTPDLSSYDLFMGAGEKEEEVPKMSRLEISLWNPRDVYLDPTNRNRFKILTSNYTIGEFRYEGNRRNFKFMEEVIQDRRRPDVGEEVSDRNRLAQVGESLIQEQDTINLIELWGDLYDKDGEMLKKNFHGIVAQEKYLVYSDDNPFAHKECPVIVNFLLKDPFAVYGDSYVSAGIDVLESWVEFLNMLTDFYQTRILSQYEIDVDLLAEGEDLSEGGYPGKYWEKRGAGQLITPVLQGDVPEQFPLFMEILNNELQEDTALNDAQAGLPRTRGRISSQEFTRRMAESGTLFDYAFKAIETNFLEPILRQSFINMLQFTPNDIWEKWVYNKISSIVEDDMSMLSQKNPQQQMPQDPQQKVQMVAQTNPLINLYLGLAKMSPDERIQKFGKTIYFKTEVFSAVFDRQAMLEKLTFLLGTIAKIPQALAYFKWRPMLGIMMRALNFNEEDLLHNEVEAMQILQLMQNMGMNTPQGGQEGEGDVQQTTPPPNAAEGIALAGIGGSTGKPPQGWNQAMPGHRSAG